MQIVVSNLRHTYPTGVEALRGVSLRVESGERVALIGQNGSGKTTLAKHLNGLLRPTEGAVQIGDWDTAAHSTAQLAARVGYVFQNPDDQLFRRTVHDELRFGPHNLGLPAKEIERRVEEAAGQLRLTEKLSANPYDLSPAWRKRVAVASVLAMETPIVVLDEPTTGQDHEGVGVVAEILAMLAQRGRTVITISHDIDFVADHHARVIVMDEGNVLLDGTPDKVFGAMALLEQAAVDPPQMARLGAAIGLTETVYTVDGFLDALRREVEKSSD